MNHSLSDQVIAQRRIVFGPVAAAFGVLRLDGPIAAARDAALARRRC